MSNETQSDFDHIKLEKEDKIAKIVLNRPDILNRIDSKTISELEKALKNVDGDENLRVLIITGAGDKAFSAGFDVSELRERFESENTMQLSKESSIRGRGILELLENMDKIIIGAFNGYTIGGGMALLLGCDLKIASENAKFGLPEIKVGIYPTYGITQKLPRMIGITKANELIFTGKTIDSEEAERIGLINDVVPQDDLYEEVQDLAETISGKSKRALKYSKLLINKGLFGELDGIYSFDAELYGLCYGDEETKEALESFLEKKD